MSIKTVLPYFLPIVFSSLVFASEPSDFSPPEGVTMLSGDDLTKALSGNTVTADNDEWAEYYGANGTITGEAGWIDYDGQWMSKDTAVYFDYDGDDYDTTLMIGRDESGLLYFFDEAGQLKAKATVTKGNTL